MCKIPHIFDKLLVRWLGLGFVSPWHIERRQPTRFFYVSAAEAVCLTHVFLALQKSLDILRHNKLLRFIEMG